MMAGVTGCMVEFALQNGVWIGSDRKFAEEERASSSRSQLWQRVWELLSTDRVWVTVKAACTRGRRAHSRSSPRFISQA